MASNVFRRADVVPARRRVLRAGFAAGSLFLPLPWAYVWAQSEGAVKLLRAPKVALVIGNSKYKDSPELKNPANDARSIAEVLQACGFQVTMKLDAGREEMLSAIREYVRAMEQKVHVGLFYFAGHGVQLAWRNYLLPVDAVIDRIDDVARQSVDLARLMEGLARAANPMNVIILDACRENPFGRDFRVEQKGLSQMDAPSATFLAYATSPGNVASDGDGVNGLYTEHLLREMKVKEAKIEDVFKRVRLGVRRKTAGAQIPWESTSLEEDFYFLPPAQLTQRSEAEREKEFQEQLAAWEKLKDSTNPAPLVEFLARYPSGEFSELAQLRLDRVLARQGENRIRIASAEGNPFTKGSARLDIAYKVGDSYTYQQLDPETRTVVRKYTNRITQISESQVIFDVGLVTDLLGNTQRLPDGRSFTDNQNVPVEFEVGRQWVTRYRSATPSGASASIEVEYRIVSRDVLNVPAGTFNAFFIEGSGTFSAPKGQVELRLRAWWDPQRVRRPVAREEFRQIRLGGATRERPAWARFERAQRAEATRVIASERHELVAFQQG